MSTKCAGVGTPLLAFATFFAWGLPACERERAPLVSLDPPREGSTSSSSDEMGGATNDVPSSCGLTAKGRAVHAALPQPLAVAEQPATCEAAVAGKSYIGCDFWPTVTANLVPSIFDFAVVVANTGKTPAEVVVRYREEELARVTVAPASLEKIYLPWVDELKGWVEPCESGEGSNESVVVRGGAYHLTSDYPVVVYQFNPLEFAPMGGPPGKEWDECTATEVGNSYSNDASLLLPTQAMGTSYRGMTLTRGSGLETLTVTATRDGTGVTVYPLSDAVIAEGAGVPRVKGALPPSFMLDAGDVLQMLPGLGTLSGTVIESDQPVQVISGNECTNIPYDVAACDHLEETLPPAQALGRRYFVGAPTGPAGAPIRYAVQLTGNQDETLLYYTGTKPSHAPGALRAGESVLLTNLSANFEVFGDHEFGVLLFLQGGESDPGLSTNTDPSQSVAVPAEQFRRRYVFLAPDDYLVTYADVIAPSGAVITLDGAVVEANSEPFECSDYALVRIRLESAKDGVHVLEGSEPIGVQIIGHASYTSYQYPGGLNVSAIAPAPRKPR